MLRLLVSVLFRLLRRPVSIGSPVFSTRLVARGRVPGTVGRMQLLRTVRPVEFMAFAGNPEHGNSHQKHGKNFHRAALVGAPPAKSNPQAIPNSTRIHFTPRHPGASCFLALQPSGRQPSRPFGDGDTFQTMKTSLVPILFAISLQIATADPNEAELAFIQTKGATEIPGSMDPFPEGLVPEPLLVELRKNIWVPAGDEAAPVGQDRTHKFRGFTHDLNGDGKREYFVFDRLSSGSGGRAFQLYAEVKGVWRMIAHFQGGLSKFPAAKGWPTLVTLSRGGGGNYSKTFNEFRDGEYKCTLIVRYNNGKITEKVPDAGK